MIKDYLLMINAGLLGRFFWVFCFTISKKLVKKVMVQRRWNRIFLLAQTSSTPAFPCYIGFRSEFYVNINSDFEITKKDD
ncbi:hypothetical protein ACFL1G_11150 [Planctomycetota bacterium]